MTSPEQDFQPAASADPSSPPTDGAAPGLPAPTPDHSLEERVLTAVKTDPARAARVLASWLSEPDAAAAPAKGGKAA